MYQRITIRVLSEEIAALIELARREHRDPREQAAQLIKEALRRRRLLPPRGDAGQGGRA